MARPSLSMHSYRMEDHIYKLIELTGNLDRIHRGRCSKGH